MVINFSIDGNKIGVVDPETNKTRFYYVKFQGERIKNEAFVDAVIQMLSDAQDECDVTFTHLKNTRITKVSIESDFGTVTPEGHQERFQRITQIALARIPKGIGKGKEEEPEEVAEAASVPPPITFEAAPLPKERREDVVEKIEKAAEGAVYAAGRFLRSTASKIVQFFQPAQQAAMNVQFEEVVTPEVAELREKIRKAKEKNEELDAAQIIHDLARLQHFNQLVIDYLGGNEEALKEIRDAEEKGKEILHKLGLEEPNQEVAQANKEQILEIIKMLDAWNWFQKVLKRAPGVKALGDKSELAVAYQEIKKQLPPS